MPVMRRVSVRSSGILSGIWLHRNRIGRILVSMDMLSTEKINKVWLIVVGYFLITAAGLHFHELFLDEAHHFVVSRDSRSLGELYDNLRYDGHPRLWHALLFLITH